ncbi:hypothetical protein AQS70_02250 [Pseudomonas endophytica]|uniref:Lipoprotein n=1 Tax=Pseudomonas endophytica TaxID=1563157 RepID=A0A0Q0YWA4_9PSED|nr:hypothetical protein [Pseudomonas endophytica]KQB53594.1 hypothetical protein AQS70_02250 [Pseudomonas endophytica]
MPIKAKQQGALFSLIFAAAVIAGCASHPQFSGQSVTDPVLRKDVYSSIEQFFSAVTQCRSISAVDASIASLEPSPNGAIQKAVETWQVSGCGTSRTYKVVMTADDKGETDFSISQQS